MGNSGVADLNAALSTRAPASPAIIGATSFVTHWSFRWSQVWRFPVDPVGTAVGTRAHLAGGMASP